MSHVEGRLRLDFVLKIVWVMKTEKVLDAIFPKLFYINSISKIGIGMKLK